MESKDKLRIMNHIRLAFRVSELFASAFVVHPHQKGVRGGKMFLCAYCPNAFKKSEIQIDHIIPIVPFGESKLSLSLDYYAERIFCEPNNLQPLCKPCHLIKSNQEKNKRYTA
jgi:5-methylcytosine-specific restriction endonuclease McrA